MTNPPSQLYRFDTKFGSKFTRQSGILRLMEDLGQAMAAGERMLMLGGGNPARIPEVEAVFRRRMQGILDHPGELEGLIGGYDAPKGNDVFIEALAGLFQREYGWKLGPENIALTNGSQTAFFFLFNLFAEGGAGKKILLPIAPEYIGYADIGLDDGFFVANRPEIETLGDDTFKYHVDFDALDVTDEIGAICVSRPTNPTSNVLTEAELEHLSDLAQANGIPLIIDNAYGTPFPNIIFTEAEPIWNENVILSMSLSKLGLPGVRTGIVLAHPRVVEALSGLNAIISLTPGSFGAALARDLVRSGEILEMSRELIQPYYQEKANRALGWIREELDGLDYRLHKPEGTFFFWLWFEGLPITCEDLYQRLKQRGVLVVPGHYFFPGITEDWRHQRECIRLNYSQDEAVVRKGIGILAEELRKARN